MRAIWRRGRNFIARWRGFTGRYRARRETAHEVQDRLKSIREALRDTPAAEKQLDAEADAIEKNDRLILRALSGDTEMQKRNEPVASSINDRIEAIMEGERFSLAKPTQSHVDDYNIAACGVCGTARETSYFG